MFKTIFQEGVPRLLLAYLVKKIFEELIVTLPHPTQTYKYYKYFEFSKVGLLI